MLQAGRKLSFNLGDIFPDFSYPIIESLDRSILDSIFEAQKQYPVEMMGDKATIDYILRHAYGIASETIKSKSDLFKTIIKMHYKNIKLPEILSERLTEIVEKQFFDEIKTGFFKNWSLKKMINDQSFFYNILQKEWHAYVSCLGHNGSVREASPGYHFENDNLIIPFEHADIKVYIDNLFLEGKLSPIKLSNPDIDRSSWLWCGIIDDHETDNLNQINGLLEHVEKKYQKAIQGIKSGLILQENGRSLLQGFIHLKEMIFKQLKETGLRINKVFKDWLTKNYSGLAQMPPFMPVMLHHIVRYISREVRSEGGKAALIVMDGLSLDQWVTIKKEITGQAENILFKESQTFAWIPTLTSVSRQTILQVILLFILEKLLIQLVMKKSNGRNIGQA